MDSGEQQRTISINCSIVATPYLMSANHYLQQEITLNYRICEESWQHIQQSLSLIYRSVSCSLTTGELLHIQSILFLDRSTL